MTAPTRSDLERAAVAFFNDLAAQVERREGLNLDNLAVEIDFNLSESRRRIAELDAQLSANAFDNQVVASAQHILSDAGLTDRRDDAALPIVARQLAARAEREQLALLVHSLTSPGKTYRATDDLFAARSPAPVMHTPAPPAPDTMPLREAGAAYVKRKLRAGLTQTHIDELKRALGWLEQRFGSDRPIGAILKTELGRFRDDIARLDVHMRGRDVPFEARLTNDVEHQVKSVTAERYWRSVQGLFAWAASEGIIPQDPASTLKLEGRKGERKGTPPPFTQEELQHLFKTPLFAGYLAPSRQNTPGECHRRDGRWWSGVLSLFTGLRAGELSQLLPTDFVFASDIPHLKVREENEKGERVKSAKTASSIRDVPLSPVLIELGLGDFVAARAKWHPKDRVFHEFRLGTHGRKSDGMTKFWNRYLKTHRLWKEGRATHVFRHTLAACLKANDIAEEDIGAVLGHSRQSVTAGYGGQLPLTRKRKAILSLHYGFDVVAALGGPYDRKRHG
ncbi:hypothetical protein [Sphingomonas parapaucimobilis]|uniref:hypothetical protein n=1 Tax=Sphingomonas parapaucimobilis TaxID=28213 RepID=UPI00391A8FDE